MLLQPHIWHLTAADISKFSFDKFKLLSTLQSYYRRTVSPGGLTSHHVTYRPRTLWVLRSGGGLDGTAAVSGAGVVLTAAAAAFTGRDDDDDDDDDDADGWIGIVAAAVEQRTAKCSALHISAHNDGPFSLCNTMQTYSSTVCSGTTVQLLQHSVLTLCHGWKWVREWLNQT